MTLADGGCNDGHEFFETPTGINCEDQRMKAVARARHETVNQRLKSCGVLGEKFRHKPHKHAIAFNAVVNVTQMAFECEWELGEDGESTGGLFQVDCCDNHVSSQLC